MKKFFIYIFFLAMVVPVSLYAEAPVLNKVNEMPNIKEIRKKQSVNVGEYNGSGLIDEVYEKKIILNDRTLHLSSSVEIFNLKGNQLPRKLYKGQYIYYFLDSKNQISKIFVEE